MIAMTTTFIRLAVVIGVAAALAGAETIGTTELKPEQEMDQ